MSDIEFEDGSDQEVSKNHSKLIEAVSQLDGGQRVKNPERSEPSLEVSEFHLVKSGVTDKNAVHLNDLAKSLSNKSSHAEISQKIKAVQKKSKILPKPLEKPAAERIKRIVGFENVKKDLTKWAGIVARNRTAESMSFPLKQPSMKLETSSEFVKRFRIQSELEKKLAALEQKEEEVKAKEADDEFPMTLEEAKERRKEAARLRAQQSYREAKAHRQNKIKSKRYHRIQKRQKVKEQVKQFEKLQKTDPQAALEKLEQLDRTRAEERMSLRHKSTGQWAKNHQVRAKYDKESRQVLAEQLSISRELTQKLKKPDDSSEEEEEDDDENTSLSLSKGDKDNPWVNGVKTQSEIDEFVSDYRKYWDAKNKEGQQKQTRDNEEKPSETVVLDKAPKRTRDSSVESRKSSALKKSKTVSSVRQGVNIKPKEKPGIVATSKWSVVELNNDLEAGSRPSKSIEIDEIFDAMEDKTRQRIDVKLKNFKEKHNIKWNGKKDWANDEGDLAEEYAKDLGFKNRNPKPHIDEQMDETSGSRASRSSREIEKLRRIANADVDVSHRVSQDEIDPNKFISVKPKHLKSQLPDTVTGGDEALDDSAEEEERHNIMSEAFADDDVVSEFRKEKEEEVKKNQPEDLDLSLPGWGSWGGKNIVQSKRKKRRFILKFPKDAPRKDENKGDVIILEDDDAKIREHQVSEVPFPFTSVKDYEASIRAPLGRNFVPENAHQRLIRPAVTTKMGKIIEPMDEDSLVSTKNIKRKRLRGGFKKNATKVKDSE